MLDLRIKRYLFYACFSMATVVVVSRNPISYSYMFFDFLTVDGMWEGEKKTITQKDDRLLLFISMKTG